MIISQLKMDWAQSPLKFNIILILIIFIIYLKNNKFNILKNYLKNKS